MEKIVFVKGNNLDAVNEDLSTGWKVKAINACSGAASIGGQSVNSENVKSFAYIVLEKEEDK